jgi:hypothetical protein
LRKGTPEYVKHRKIAEKNGISCVTYSDRVRRGWTYEEASSLTIGTIKPRKRKITAEQFAIAEKNGISRGTLWNRVSCRKWPVEKAITVPINKKFARKTS